MHEEGRSIGRTEAGRRTGALGKCRREGSAETGNRMKGRRIEVGGAEEVQKGRVKGGQKNRR